MNLKKGWSGCKDYALEKQIDSRDNFNYLTLREEVQHYTPSAFTPVRSQGNCFPRILFEQDDQPQVSRQDSKKLFQNVEEINHYKVDIILFSDKSVQGKEVETK